jgi:hypothetical protein
MVVNPLQKACILTVLACLLAAPVQADEANPENEPEGQLDAAQGIWPPPCDFVYILFEYPFVEPHPECLPTFP